MTVPKKQEEIVIEKSVDLWNEFIKVENRHPDDTNDFRHYIHRIQEMMQAKLYREL